MIQNKWREYGLVYYGWLQIQFALLGLKNHVYVMALLQLDLKMNNDKGEGDTSTFVLNGEWHLLGNKATQRKKYQNCPIYVF